MPRVTVRNARIETLRETLETELGRWGHEGPPERFKPLLAEIEAELKYRDEQLEHQPWHLRTQSERDNGYVVRIFSKHIKGTGSAQGRDQ